LLAGPARAHLSIQFSPAIFIYGGYDLRMALKRSYFRYQVEIFKVDEAEYIDESSPFSIETKTIGATLSFFPMDRDGIGKGPYLGAAYHRVRWDFFHPPSGLNLSRKADFLGPLAGYQYFFSDSGFFMTAEVRYQKNVTSTRDLTVQGQTNEIPESAFTPILGFGYSF
jgi:hypothetical protein